MGRIPVALRVVAIQRSVPTLRQVPTVRVAVMAQELRSVEVALSRLGTHVSGIRNGIALIASDEDPLCDEYPFGQPHLANRHGRFAPVQSSVTLVC